MHLNIDVLNIFDRFLSDNIQIAVKNQPVTKEHLNQRMEIRIFADPPCYTAVYYVDGRPILSENMIDSIARFIEETQNHNNFLSFLVEYASVSHV